MDYKNTIITPKTDFPMRAGLPQREPGMLEHWNKIDVYRLMLEKNEGKPAFILHDGPPFSNGDIHMGHALNKTLKDFIVRSHAMRGYYTPYVPGWDNHGMPIESAIIKKNKLNHKAMPIPEFRNACQAFAQDFIDRQMSGFRRLGVLGDWQHPYKTMDKAFEAEEVKVFGEMYRKGYIYKGLKPVYWCPKDETALAEAEIEYQDDPCTSIYVKFALKDTKGKLEAENTYVIIWTTTTWTLPGNLAIALNPQESYVIVKAANGERYLVAEALLEKTMKAGGIEEYEIVERHEGRYFEYMTAQHPFLPRESLLVCADYVTMDSGTGCVHTAPGFGADDYQTCRRYNIDLIVPVDDRGRQTEAAGKYAGLRYDESNAVILADLKESGALFASEEFTHSYPHCWRCKSPIIFRATPQWFCSVESFKDEAVAACDNVRWLPAWGKDRMVSMIRERADWCISRQRRWGLPIPVFYCSDCGKPVCTDDTIKAVSDIFREKGSNAWFEMDAAELLPEGFTCPHCGGRHFTKETDTLDGWFDSGSTHIASMELDSPGRWPAEMYLEGGDQFRGWFQSSLLIGVATKGKAPYKTCLCHGWTVDGEGKAMHKSLGNGVDPADLIAKYGADLVRLWASSADYRVDMRCSDAIFKQLSEKYLKIRNTARYILGNLQGFDPNKDTVPVDQMPELDRWALSRLNALVERCINAYEKYEFFGVTAAIHSFCVVDMSNFYLDVIKDRLYCDGADSLSRRSAQTTIYMILDAMMRLLAPLLAFTSNEVWQDMPHSDKEDARHVMLNDMPKPDAALKLSPEAELRWSNLLRIRDDVNKALELARAEKIVGKPLDAKVTIHVGEDAKAAWASVQGVDLAQLCIVSELEVSDAPIEGWAGESVPGLTIKVEASTLPKCPRCWTHSAGIGSDEKHPELCPRCAKAVG